MKNHEGVYIKLHKINDADLIERLHHVDNKQGYIKDLIKADIRYIKRVQTFLEKGGKP